MTPKLGVRRKNSALNFIQISTTRCKISRPSISRINRTPVAGLGLHCRITLGEYGLRRLRGNALQHWNQTIRPYPQNHLSHKERTMMLKGSGKQNMVKQWYDKLQPEVKVKIHKCGFKPLIQGLQQREIEHGLIQSLAERWWDTTHTFHMHNIGEMTMTPKDFSAITGLHVSGKPISVDKIIHLKKNKIIKLMGQPMSQVNGTSVSVEWLYNTYSEVHCVDDKAVDVMVRAFVLALLGAVVFATPDCQVPLEYLPSLVHVDKIGTYNWGAAALAFMYHEMDDLCRGCKETLGGLWRSWEVWAKEYIPSIRVQEPFIGGKGFPKCVRWMQPNAQTLDVRTMLDYYRCKLGQLKYEEVIWDPWGHDKDLPQYVKKSIRPTGQRILLYGSEGGAWYLGERVGLQTMKNTSHFIPMHPPRGMLLPYPCKVTNIHSALLGRSATLFQDKSVPITIDEYNTIFPNRDNIKGKKVHEEGTSDTKCCSAYENEAENEDGVPMPPWTVLLPTLEGGGNVIRIPTDVNMHNIDIPPHVQQVSAQKARKLLQMIGGMQKLLIDNIIETKDKLADSAATIQSLRYKLYLHEMGDQGDRFQE